MKRIIDVDMEIRAKKFETAVNRFFKKYPELDYWKDTFEYMHEAGENHFIDNVLGDGSKNKDWRYSLWLDEDDGYFYFAITERA